VEICKIWSLEPITEPFIAMKLAVYLLKQTNKFHKADIVRSRDPKVLDSCDIVVDVGGVYDAERLRFDHHQRGFSEVFGYGFSTKLSSAGLIYKHFGKEIIANRAEVNVAEPVVNTLWLKMYKEFIEAIDGIDNGISQFPDDSKARYRNRTDLSSRVSWLNPSWNESTDSAGVDSLFLQASKLTGEEFLGRLDYYRNSWMPARDLVLSAFNDRKEVDKSGHLILFRKFAPWKEHLFEIEEEQVVKEDEKPFYIVYPDEAASNWRIQAVPISPDSFDSRKALPAPWRGVRDSELSSVTGIGGCIFVHASGFIGGNATEEGALAMARQALQD